MRSNAGEAVIGVDVGGTKTHAVAYDNQFKTLAEVVVPTTTGTASLVEASIVDVLDKIWSQLNGAAVTGVGIGIPGMVDTDRGVVRHAVNLGVGDEGMAIAARVSDSHHVRCWVDNDVNVAALGAYQVLRSSIVAARDLAFISVGTGVAAGIILEDKVHRGRHGFAGEIGHLPADPSGPQCECGLTGCLEAVASGTAITRRWPTKGSTSPAADLIEAAGTGNPAAQQLVDEIGDHLGRAVHLLALTFDVDLFVLGGGVADIGEPLLRIIKDGLRRLERQSDVLRSLALSDRVILTPDDAVSVIGAASLTGLRRPS